jgi:hypothetical protein
MVYKLAGVGQKAARGHVFALEVSRPVLNQTE